MEGKSPRPPTSQPAEGVGAYIGDGGRLAAALAVLIVALLVVVASSASHRNFAAVPSGIAAFVGTGRDSAGATRRGLMPPSTEDCLDAARWWARLVPVVPLAPDLVVGKPGEKPHPQPLIRWRQNGPLTTEEEVRAFWADHPDAQLAIVLGKTADGRWLGGVDTDLKHRATGMPEPPIGFMNCYRESTKGGGFHDPFIYKIDPPKTVPRRAIGIGGFVDVLLEGLLVVAPSSFGRDGSYREARPGPIAEFEAPGLALDSAAHWLKEAWKKHRPSSSGDARGAAVELGTDGKLPHGRHYEWLLSFTAAFVSRTGGITEAQAIRATRAAFSSVADDVVSHESEIGQLVRSALAKYGNPTQRPILDPDLVRWAHDSAERSG